MISVIMICVVAATTAVLQAMAAGLLPHPLVILIDQPVISCLDLIMRWVGRVVGLVGVGAEGTEGLTLGALEALGGINPTAEEGQTGTQHISSRITRMTSSSSSMQCRAVSSSCKGRGLVQQVCSSSSSRMAGTAVVKAWVRTVHQIRS